MKNLLILCIILFSNLFIYAQEGFPERCEGEWIGEMNIYDHGQIKDTITVSMTIAALKDTLGWTWRTSYQTAKGEIVNDYNLYPNGSKQNEYILDENNGILLYAYVHGNKMYSNFKVQESYLSSVYERKGDQLIFEIIYGKDLGKTGNDISNFSVDGLQRSVLHRRK